MKNFNFLLITFLSILLNTLVEFASSAKTSAPGEVAEKKCQEYSCWLESLNGDKFAGECGISVFNNQGAEKAGTLEFPHMAHLGYDIKGNISYLCSASLISEEYLLTAAVCVQNRYIPIPIVAKLGGDDPENQIILKVSTIIVHPDYTPTKQYKDIALIRLEEPLAYFTSSMRPACIHTTKTVNEPKAIATGWGRTTDNGPTSDGLVKVGLKFVAHKNCTTYYKFLENGIDDESMICAKSSNGRDDACAGFGGGPLQVVRKEPECMYGIVGITSFGAECGIAPGVYTRVSHYVSWIESIVWPGE